MLTDSYQTVSFKRKLAASARKFGLTYEEDCAFRNDNPSISVTVLFKSVPFFAVLKNGRRLQSFGNADDACTYLTEVLDGNKNLLG